MLALTVIAQGPQFVAAHDEELDVAGVGVDPGVARCRRVPRWYLLSLLAARPYDASRRVWW